MLDWLIVAQTLRPRWPATGLGASYVAHTHIISSSWKLLGGASSKTNSRHNMGFNTDWQQRLTHESSSQGLKRYEKVKKNTSQQDAILNLMYLIAFGYLACFSDVSTCICMLHDLEG